MEHTQNRLGHGLGQDDFGASALGPILWAMTCGPWGMSCVLWHVSYVLCPVPCVPWPVSYFLCPVSSVLSCVLDPKVMAETMNRLKGTG